MIDFNRKPTEKSEEEKAFDKVNAEYAEKFGAPYAIYYGLNDMTWAEMIADVRRRIDTDTPQEQPEYLPGADY